MSESVVKESIKMGEPIPTIFPHTLKDFTTCNIPECPKCAEFVYNIYIQSKAMFKEEPKEKTNS